MAGGGGRGRRREAQCVICLDWRAPDEVGFIEGCLHWICQDCAQVWAAAAPGAGGGAEVCGRGGAEGARPPSPKRCPLCRAPFTGLLLPGNPVRRLHVGGVRAGSTEELGVRLSVRQLGRRRAYLAGSAAPAPEDVAALAAHGTRPGGYPAAVRAGDPAREVEAFARADLEALTLSSDIALLARSVAAVCRPPQEATTARWDAVRGSVVAQLAGSLSTSQAELFSRYLVAFASAGVTLRSFDGLLQQYWDESGGAGGTDTALRDGLRLAAALRGAAGRQAQAIRRRASRAPEGSRAAKALRSMALEFLEARHAVGAVVAEAFGAAGADSRAADAAGEDSLLLKLRRWLEESGDELFQGVGEAELLREDAEMRGGLAAEESACLQKLSNINVAGGRPSERILALKAVLRRLHAVEEGPRLPLALWREAPAAARKSGYSQDNFSYGSTPLSSWWLVFSHPEIVQPVQRASTGAMECMVWGSSIGWLVFYGALGLGVRSVGYEIVQSLNDIALETCEAVGLDGPGSRGMVEFNRADMLTSDLSKSSVVILTSQCWDAGLVRAACSKIAQELPDGSVAVDYGESLTEWLGSPVAVVTAPVSWNEEQRFFIYRKAGGCSGAEAGGAPGEAGPSI